MADWDLRFLGLAQHVATWSKDPSTKVGAVIARPDRTVASVGFNGFPKGSVDNEELYRDREVKLERIVHAEVNAIVHAQENLSGFTLYSTLMPCARCASVIIQVGIIRVATRTPLAVTPAWLGSFEHSAKLFRECGIEVSCVANKAA